MPQEPYDDTFELEPLQGHAITAALMNTESEVDLPGRGRPASVVSNLLALKVGDNYTRSLGIPATTTVAEIEEGINTWRAELRNSVNQSIRHARKQDNRKFRMESAHTVTPSGGVYLQVIVTRVE